MIVVSEIKLHFLGQPFYLQDLAYISNLSEIINISKNGLFSMITSMPISVFICLILLIFLNIISFKFNNKINRFSRKSIITLFVSIIVIILLVIPNKTINHFILKHFYAIDKREDYSAILSNDQYYHMYGPLLSLYSNMLESRVFKPGDYDENLIENTLKNSKKENNKILGKPNIIVIFSESFFDVDLIDEIKFDKKITENYNNLKEKGLVFDMLSPSYGGISANVEFEFLTGGSLNYFGMSSVPYMQFYNNSNYYDSPSIIKELKNNGYYTKLSSFTSSKLFDCQKAYNFFEIDDVDYDLNVDEKNIKGTYPSEDYVVDKIIKQLNDSKKPLFYMIRTMETHMPNYLNKYTDYDIDIEYSNLDRSVTSYLKSFSQGIYDADIALGKIYEYIQTIDEPTLIIFYGDHLPYLGDTTKFSYFSTDDEKLNLYRIYNTEGLILSNYDISELKVENENIKYLGPDLLGTYILNHMDINISDYYVWLYNTKDTIGTSNRFLSVDQAGNIYYNNELPDKMKELYDYFLGSRGSIWLCRS